LLSQLLPEEDGKMATEDFWNKVCRAWEDAVNRGETGAFDEVFSPDYVHHEPPFPDKVGREVFKQDVASERSAIWPDLQLRMGELIAQGDKAAAKFTIEATLMGTLPPYVNEPGSGKHVLVTGLLSARCEGDQVVEAWIYGDYLGMVQQLGAFQPQGQE
jgi:predicted ester cyclase